MYLGEYLGEYLAAPAESVRRMGGDQVCHIGPRAANSEGERIRREELLRLDELGSGDVGGIGD